VRLLGSIAACRESGPFKELDPEAEREAVSACLSILAEPDASVELQACVAGSATQAWATPAGNVAGKITDAKGACLEVTKNEVGAGVLMEVWGCNGGANQAFCATSGGLLLSSLDGECVSACAA
jgi:hypothetical protein